jgi:hypothetical protein
VLLEADHRPRSSCRDLPGLGVARLELLQLLDAFPQIVEVTVGALEPGHELLGCFGGPVYAKLGLFVEVIERPVQLIYEGVEPFANRL